MSLSFTNKIKPILIKTSSKSPTKDPLRKLEYKSNKYILKEYGSKCDIKYKYTSLLLENLLFNKNSHIVAVFKDYMISDYIDEFLKRYYRKKESSKKIRQFSAFYTNYQTYFCIPTYRLKFYNKVIHRQREKKAKCFYNEKFKNKESNNNNTNSENDIGEVEGAVSVGGKAHKGRLYLKNRFDKNNNKKFFNDEIKEILDKETMSNYTMSLPESGSKLKNNNSYLLISYSNEESLCNIMNGLYNKKLFITKCETNRTNNKILNKKNLHSNSAIALNTNNNTKINNNKIKLVLKKRIINIKNKNNNNYESSDINNNENNNTKKPSNLSANIINKLKVQNLKIILNNKEHEKSASNKKYIKKIGLWNIINNDKENRRVKSQDNNLIKKAENILTFHKGKKMTRNISYVTLYNKKKTLPTNKSNMSNKMYSNQINKNKIRNRDFEIFRNNINDYTKNLNYSKDKIGNMKKRSYRPIRLSKSNININNNDILLNKIKSKVYDILQKKAQNRENLHLKKAGENSDKYNNNINYNTTKLTPNKLKIFYHNINPIKENNYMTNNYRRNHSNKFDLKTNSNIFRSNKLSKSPSISEFVRYLRIQKNNQNINAKNSQRKYQTLEGKNNNIQNLNININNQINIRLNNINELPSENYNNNLNKKNHSRDKIIKRNKNKSLEFNTNQNYIIKEDNNIPTILQQNNKKRKLRVFPNKSLYKI